MNFNSLINSRHREQVEVDFVSTWRTTIASETITLPTLTNYEVDWGDGTSTTNANSHIYSIAGDYEIKIIGGVTDFSFNNTGDKDKIINISNFGGIEIISSAFFGCTNIDITATDIPVIQGVVNVFKDCSSLIFNSSIYDWEVNTSNISAMFFGATSFNQKIFPFNSTMTVLSSFFRDSNSFNQPIEGDTSQVKRMDNFFRGCTAFNQPLDHLNYSSVERIQNFMFGKTSANYDADYYADLLIKWDDLGNGGLDISIADIFTIGMGSIKYSSYGASARANLVAKGWIITDGGQV